MTWLIVSVSAFGALFAIWLGYPALMWLWSRGRGTGVLPAAPSELPRLSVIIVTRETPEIIRARIDDVLAVIYPADRLEVVVALDARVDPATYANISEDSRVRVVRGDEPGGKSAGLNAAARHATGDLLVFTDSWQRFEAQALYRLALACQDPKVGAVSGYLNIATDENGSTLLHSYMRYELWLRQLEARVHSPPGLVGAINAMPRALWEPLPAGLILDDVYVAMRVVFQGRRVAFERGAVTHDLRPPEPASEFRRKVRTMTGILQLCSWMPGILDPRKNPIWLQFMVHRVLRLTTPYLALIASIAGAGAIVQWLGQHEVSLLPLIVVVAAAAVLSLLVTALRTRAMKIATWVLAMQAAALVATVNGMRRQWDVWRP